ncbi:putative cysteine-rich repeat secretory protein 21 [Capsella rubella]|uniref:putative cysteine-rich repeat secretory protein 21 n=1 Tax=Capsella rubella TaxID=81985 RepID=UPI000CD58383|nr:putative cysteine-rich repeat secretory protein 21 [Capsella rubella]
MTVLKLLNSKTMYLSSSVPIFAIVAVQLFFIRSVFSLNQTNAYLNHNCINEQGTYMPGSPYDKNLNSLISTISNLNYNFGFVYSSNGDAPNAVFIKLQCRGDSYFSKCRSCLATAKSEISRRCPKNKGTIIWYDHCVLEISPSDTFDKIDYENSFDMYNAKDVKSDLEAFNKNTWDLLNELKEKANKKSKKDFMFAAGEKSLGTKKLYAMVQCTKDLTPNNCNVCLKWIMGKLPKCCKGKEGGRVLSTSCNFRYELYPFLMI